RRAKAREAARSRPARAAREDRKSSSREEQQREQRDEAVGQIDRDATLLNSADLRREVLRRACDGEIQPIPRVIGCRDGVNRLCIEGRGQMTLDAEKRLE